MSRFCRVRMLWAGLLCLALGVCGSRGAGDESDVQRQLRLLREQNALLQRQVNQQQEVIDTLTGKVAALEQDRSGRGAAEDDATVDPAGSGSWLGSLGLGKIHLGAEGGLALFHTGSRGPFPNTEFVLDEAKLFLEAPLWRETYFFTELNLAGARDDPVSDLYLRVGELYLDFENLSRFWNRDRQLNLRIGRLDIPFGEEYLVRDAIDNPLITHSLADVWGVDEGVELYGALGPVSYVLAVQNGGHPSLHDYNGDKSVAGRLSYTPARWLHLSASGMRTGKLAVEGDEISEVWLGNGFIRSIGGPNTTRFGAELAEGDVQLRLPRGHLKGAGGYVHYHDNDPDADNQRDIYYYYVEGLVHATKKFYLASRFSQVFAADGFPLLGHGDYFEYFMQTLTTGLHRMSVGGGYRFSPNLVVKAEFTWDAGRELGGQKRFRENFAGVEAAFKF